MARVIENWALAMSPLVLAVGSQVTVFCALAMSGAAATTAIDRAAAIRFTKAFIKDLPDVSIKGWCWWN